jgi:NADH:ubiquinone reductase (H+-translocating)
MATPHVVILGGGFGGLYAAKALRHAPVKVTVVDRRNHHIFQPLLYQVATAALNPSDIAYPIRSVLRKSQNTDVILADATRIDVPGKRVILADGAIGYDYLVVATGATHSYFGHDDWERTAPGLKTIEDALEIRRRVLYAFEAAERETRPEAKRAWLTFVVVGGGATGVEVAGALAEVARHSLARDFRHIDPTQARVLLLEGGPRILPAFPPDLSEVAHDQLRRLGVEVRLKAVVTNMDMGGVWVGDERIETRTPVWGAGVKASPIGKTLGVPLDRAGRIKVDSFLNVPGHEEIFVIGDLAAAESEGKPVPGLASAAIQMGQFAARVIQRRVAGETPKPFKYVDKGTLATVGRGSAVAQFGKVKLAGFIAWAAWLFIHILLLIGFRNRIVVFVQWAWAYLTYQRGARLITGEPATICEHTEQPKVTTEQPAADGKAQTSP